MKNLYHLVIVLFFSTAFSNVLYGQAVSINGSGAVPDPQSILDVSSTNKGVLLPRLSNHTDVTPTNGSDFGLTVYDLTTDSYWYWNGTGWEEISTASTLDAAYDGGGSGAGYLITADAGAVEISGTGGGIALDTDGDVRLDDGQWVGLGSTIERIQFDAGFDRINIKAADLSLDANKWIGLDASSPRLLFEDGAPGIVHVDEANIQMEDATWIGLGLSIERIEFDAAGRVDFRKVDIEVDQGRWIGIGSSVERIEFDGADDEINVLGAEFGIGTADPSAQLHTTGTIRFENFASGFLEVDGLGNVSVASGSGLFTDGTGLSWSGTTLNSVWTENSADIYNNNSGNVGLGNSSPGEKLEVTGNILLTGAAARTLSVADGVANGENGFSLTVSAANGSSAGASAADGGNLILSAGSQHDQNLDNAVGGNIEIRGGTNTWGGGGTLDTDEGEIRFYTDNTERMQVQSDGNVGIGVTDPSVKLQVAGDVTCSGKMNSNGIEELSDRRFKKDIKPLEGALSNVMSLEGVSYHWRIEDFPERNFGNREEIGVIAQEIEKVYPEVVSTDANGYKAVQYSHLVPVLIEAIKEQQLIIGNLKTDLEEAKASIKTQEQILLELSTKSGNSRSGSSELSDLH